MVFQIVKQLRCYQDTAFQTFKDGEIDDGSQRDSPPDSSQVAKSLAVVEGEDQSGDIHDDASHHKGDRNRDKDT